MATRTIRPGQTLTASGSINLSGYLTIQGSGAGGGPGGKGIVANTASVANRGTIAVLGGAPVSGFFDPIGGGTLTVDGSLANAGLIELEGSATAPDGSNGGSGYLLDAGVLTNAGAISVGAGLYSTGGAYTGRGGIFQLTGVLINQSTITIDSSKYSSINRYAVGTLFDNGTLMNAGLLTVQGGGVSGISKVDGGDGGKLTGDGSLTNTGTVVLEGGVGAIAAGEHGGHPGYLYMKGSVVNDGTILLMGGGAGLETHIGHGYGFGSGYGASLFSPSVTNNGLLIIGAGVPPTTKNEIGGLGAIVWVYDNAKLMNTGTITVDGAKGNPTLQGESRYSGVLVIHDSHAYNSGLITLSGAGANDTSGGFLGVNGESFGRGVLDDAGTIAIGLPTTTGGKPGVLSVSLYAYLNLTGGSIVQKEVGYAANMVYDGGKISGCGLIDVSSIDSYGVIEASGGLLSITANISDGIRGPGKLLVDAGATLSLSGTLSTNQSFTLASTGTLIAPAADASLKISSPVGGNVTIIGGGTTTLNSKDTDLTVNLAAAGNLTLSQAGFITAIGSSGTDTIVAQAAGQTLEGKAGADALIGYTGAGDTFLGTAAELNGDTVSNFIGTDVIDVTDLAAGPGLSLSYTQGGTSGVLTVSESGQSSKITLTGSFTQDQFTTVSDGHGGSLIGVH